MCFYLVVTQICVLYMCMNLWIRNTRVWIMVSWGGVAQRSCWMFTWLVTSLPRLMAQRTPGGTTGAEKSGPSSMCRWMDEGAVQWKLPTLVSWSWFLIDPMEMLAYDFFLMLAGLVGVLDEPMKQSTWTTNGLSLTTMNQWVNNHNMVVSQNRGTSKSSVNSHFQ